jgi:hypothetical protein
MPRQKRNAEALAQAAASMAEAAVSAAETEAQTGTNGVHVVEYEDEDEQAEPRSLGPLFQLPADKRARHLHTRVYRDEPIDEGFLGNIGPDDTEDTIRRRWGGTVFHVEAVDEHGTFLKRRFGIRISAEPKFTNTLARKKYKAWLEGEFAEEKPATPAPNSGPTQRTAEDQSALEEDRHRRELARIKAEAEAYSARAKSDLDLTVARLRAEGEAAVARASAEGAASVARVRAESDEREKRDRAFYDAQIKQQSEWMAITKTQEKAQDPLVMLKTMTGIYADMREASGGDGHAPDVGTAIVENLDKILGAASSLAGDSRTPAGQPKRPAPAAPRSSAEEPVTLTDALAKKAKLAARHLQSQGVRNPSAALSQQIERAFDRVMQTRVMAGGSAAKRGAAKAKPKK